MQPVSKWNVVACTVFRHCDGVIPICFVAFLLVLEPRAPVLFRSGLRLLFRSPLDVWFCACFGRGVAWLGGARVYALALPSLALRLPNALALARPSLALLCGALALALPSLALLRGALALCGLGGARVYALAPFRPWATVPIPTVPSLVVPPRIGALAKPRIGTRAIPWIGTLAKPQIVAAPA